MCCFEGNKKSLVDAMKKGINLREQILRSYGDNYHGGLMKLVVIGGGIVLLCNTFDVIVFNRTFSCNIANHTPNTMKNIKL